MKAASRVAGLRGVGVEAINGAAHVQLRQADAREARVPGVEAVPPFAGRVVPDIAPLGIDREDEVGQRHGGHAFLAEAVRFAGRHARQRHRALAPLLVAPLQLEGRQGNLLQFGGDLFRRPRRHDAVNDLAAVRRQGNRPHEDIGEMALPVAAQDSNT